LPFFFAGLCIGLPLAAWPQRANALYAANLLGSAVGSLAVLVLVPLLGGIGAVISACLLGALAALAFSQPAKGPRQLLRWLYPLAIVSLLLLSLNPPAAFALRLSPYKTLSTALLFPQSRLAFSQWNAFSRVDVVESDGIHSAPGLSLRFSGQLPKQIGLLVDGGNLSPITCIHDPADAQFLDYLPTRCGPPHGRW